MMSNKGEAFTRACECPLSNRSLLLWKQASADCVQHLVSPTALKSPADPLRQLLVLVLEENKVQVVLEIRSKGSN